jgi:hypothetical protein
LTPSASQPATGAARAAGERRPGVPRLTADPDRAVLLTRLFIEALNARDVDGLMSLVSDEVEFRNAFGGRSLRGRDAVERLVRAAADANLSFVRRGDPEITVRGGTVRIEVPVVEQVGGSEIVGTAIFEVQDGSITAFQVSSELLRR